MQTERQQEERAKQQGTSEKGMEYTGKHGRTWEAAWRRWTGKGYLKGKCRACLQATVCTFHLRFLGSD